MGHNILRLRCISKSKHHVLTTVARQPHEYRPREIHELQLLAAFWVKLALDNNSPSHPVPDPLATNLCLSTRTNPSQPRAETHDPPDWSCAGIQFHFHLILRARIRVVGKERDGDSPYRACGLEPETGRRIRLADSQLRLLYEG